MSRLLFLTVAACLVVSVPAQAGILIPQSSTWKYFKGTAEASSPTSAWRALAFDDSSWSAGLAPFYYGEALSGTLLGDMQGLYSCVFLRTTFEIADPAAVAELRINAIIDDGFIVWINGAEVSRFNMPAGEPARGSLALIGIEPQNEARTITNFVGLLNAGQNVIAVQAFNSALATSSDFAFDTSLTSHAAEATPPSVASIIPLPGSLTALTQITVTFDEPVAGIRSSDLLINGNPATAMTGLGPYTFTFPQPNYGTVLISWSEQHGIADYAAQANRFDHTAPASTWQYDLVDQVPPVISNLLPPAGATLRALSQVDVTFSEEVIGVDAGDLRLNGQPATNVFRVGSGPFTFQFASAAPGPVEVTWSGNPGITDVAQSPNAFVPVSWSYNVDPNAVAGDLVITEILAANQTGLVDEDGQAEDWIEIYNRGTATVNLAGWSLSDDTDDPGRWVFPARAMAPGEYLIVFASGKDRRNPAPANRFHTNFRLANGGEFLGLYTPDSPRLLISGFAPAFPEQRNDYSFGYDSQGALRYFAAPSPGVANGVSTILSVTEPVHFSVERGFYSNAFDLHLSSPTLGSAVRYTLDGVEPTATTGIVYSGPLRITNSTMIRAIALRQNFLPSIVGTHSYLFNFTAAQRALPVINLVTPLSNWVGRSGILGMAGGSRAADGLYITNNPATDYHNPSQHGIAWERPVSAEYILPQDNSGFQIDCGIRVQGSDWQRPRTTADSKFSYRLYFRGDYGQGRLEYPIFPLTSVQSFDQIVLRAGFNEQVNPFIRDEMCRRLSHDMGQIASVGGLALVLRNGGVYTNNLGLLPAYNLCERVNSEFLQSHLGGGPDWDVIAPSFAISAEGVGIIDGDRIDFANLMTNVWGSALRPMTNQAAYQAISRRLDLPNFVDYCLLNAYTAMGDWPANNWRAARERSTNGIWRFIVWDAEWGMGIYALAVTRDSFAFTGTGTEDAGLASTGNSEIARLYQALRQNREFRLLWADRIHKHFFNGGALTSLNISNRFNELGAQLQPSFSPPANMDPEIPAWARDRFPIVMGQFNTYGLYGYSNALYGIFASSNAPVFNQHGGRVPQGFMLSMTAPLGGSIHYTTNGHDPRVPFSGAVSNVAATYAGPIALDRTVVIKARALHNGTNWSALAEAEFRADSLVVPLRITEIMFNPIGGSAFEFIELENYGATPLDLADMSFTGINFSFPDPTILAPGARIVLASDGNPGAFASRYPGVTVAGYFGGQLNNAGEEIVLLDDADRIILSVSYDNEGLWPAGADGAGYSLVFVNVAGDPDDALNWRASAAQGGTPGAGEVFPGDPATVVLSEISATAQWIEVQNQTAGPINLGGYSLTDDSQARKFVLPSLVIAAGQYLRLDATNFFTLSARGDEVLLYDPQTNLISRVSFGLQAPGYTLSLIGGNWVLGSPTPNAANVSATLGSAGNLVINEWLANPLASEDDWIELWNSGPQPVALQGIYVGTSNAIFRVTSRSFIAPFGFAQLFADEDPGPDHLDFRLPATGGRILVYDSGGTEVNQVNYGAQAENVSQGRLPDGSATIQPFPGSASPSASNYIITYSGPYLNEVMARNVSAVTNPLGRVPDWVEIYNPAASQFDLTGMSLSVDSASGARWVFPAGSVVAASGYLVVWCDGDLPASTSFGANLNCGQSLDGDSGGVYLFGGASGQLVNFIEYGFQVPNRSIGRVGVPWRLLDTASPGAANGAATALGSANTLMFNEWMADPARGDDWFELYNPATLPVDLGGLTLTDDPSLGGLGKFRITPLSFIGAKDWVRFEADGDPALGFHHVNFSLEAGGESLRLNNAANVPIASVYFGPQTVGVSEGRLPDGAAAIVRFPGSPTPGESNHQLPGHVFIHEVLASTGEIELSNPSAELANIGGWFLSNSRLDYKLYRIPDGTAIPAGGYLVLTPTGFDLDPGLGGEVILSVADAAGNLNGQRVHESFRRHLPAVSFGRFTTSQGVEFSALAQWTPGAANSAAQVGPIVINEIMYNPAPGGDEYIELRNISSGDQSLSGWTLANAVRVTLPDVILPAGDFALIPILTEHGALDNGGERIDLVMPGGIVIDSVDYRDSTPWPSGLVDGDGLSLQRRNGGQFGNEPLNWLASEPTPGSANGSGVVTPPSIIIAPQSQTIASDSIVTLNVQASGGVPLGYQWRFNGIEIPGENTADLTINFAQLENTGSYDVLVSNPAGVTLSGAATLIVETTPLVLNPPQTINVNPGGSGTFSVVVRASQPISYQWRFNGQPIAGATSSSYSFSNAQLGDIGEYSVFISNPLGSASAAANLNVLIPPLFTLQPVSQTVVEGDDATFRAAVVGLPPFGFRWRRGGGNIFNGIGVNTLIMTMTNVPLSFSNTLVDCIASNPVRPAPGGVQSARVPIYVLPDTDHDRLPDVWETANGFNVNDPNDASSDADNDGRTNREEYLAGTDPNDSASYLRITLVNAAFSPTPAVLLSFNAASNKTYTVQYRDELAGSGWGKLIDVESATTNRFMQVPDASPNAASRFYQLLTPATR